MKIIFLDVDGVLNTSKTIERVYNIFQNTGKKELDIDPIRLEYLKSIMDETDSKIVLSSTWSVFFKKLNDEIVPINKKGKLFFDLLNKYDIEIYDILNYKVEINREHLIMDWLSINEVDSFIIIDDDPSMFKELSDRLIKTSKVKDNQILTNMDDCLGLCEYHIQIAKDMLKSKIKTKK